MTTHTTVGQSVHFTIDVNGGVPPYRYQWYYQLHDWGIMEGDSSKDFNFIPSTTGSYQITVRVWDSSSTSGYFIGIPVVVWVIVEPAPPVSPTPNPTYSNEPLSIVLSPQHSTININQQVYLTSSVKGGTPPYSYHWYSSFEDPNHVGKEISTAPSFIFTPNSTGSYFFRFQVTDSTGASALQFIIPMSVTVTETSTPISPPISTTTPSPNPTPSLSPTPSPSIPEFPTSIVFAFLIAALLIGTIFCRKKR